MTDSIKAMLAGSIFFLAGAACFATFFWFACYHLPSGWLAAACLLISVVTMLFSAAVTFIAAIVAWSGWEEWRAEVSLRRAQRARAKVITEIDDLLEKSRE
jgi:hypothetical protein